MRERSEGERRATTSLAAGFIEGRPTGVARKPSHSTNIFDIG